MQNQMRMPMSKTGAHCQRRRPVLLEHENARDPAEQADTASGRQVDVAREE